MDFFGTDGEKKSEPSPKYNEGLRAPVTTLVSAGAPRAKVHSSEWAKVMAGQPVEINPSIGTGFKVMTIAEYTSRWKRNDDLPDCLNCGSTETKEHHFVQSWCRSKKKWESETFCTSCHAWSWRSYCDPDFIMPEMYEKLTWENAVVEEEQRKQDAVAARPKRAVAAA